MRRLPGAIGLAVGLAAMIAPRRLVAAYGADPEELGPMGELGWRLFAARNLIVGGAATAGFGPAQDAVLAIQAPDQLVFWQALRSGSLPRATAVLAIATSGAVVAADAAARLRGS